MDSSRRQFATHGDKAARTQSMRGRMALEGLYVPSINRDPRFREDASRTAY